MPPLNPVLTTVANGMVLDQSQVIAQVDFDIYVDSISGSDANIGTIASPVQSFVVAQRLKAADWRRGGRIRYAAGDLTIPANAVTYLGPGALGSESSPELWVGTGVDQFGAVTTDTRATPTLSSGMTAVDTVANVTSTTGLPASGTVLIGFESCAYTSVTATSFVGLVRGANATTHAIGAPVVVTSATRTSTSAAATSVSDTGLSASFRSGAVASITAITGVGQTKTMTVTGMTGLTAADVGKQFLFGLATNISSLNAATTSVTVALSTSPNVWTISGLTGGSFLAGSVGNFIKLAGLGSAGNNGIFRIVAFVSATSVRIFNPLGVAEGPTAAVVWSERALQSSRTGNNGFFQMASFISATNATFYNAQALVEASGLIYWQDSYRGSYLRMVTGAAALQNARCITDLGTDATGLINVVPFASLVDNDNFTVPDGTNAATVFEYQTTGGFVPVGGRITIDVRTLVTAADVANATALAINAVAPTILRVRATNTSGSAQVQVRNMLPGSIGNVTITEAVANASFTVSGFTGGAGVVTGTFSFPLQSFSPAPSAADQFVIEKPGSVFKFTVWYMQGLRTTIGMQNIKMAATNTGSGRLVWNSLTISYDRVEFDLAGGALHNKFPLVNENFNLAAVSLWRNDTVQSFSNTFQVFYQHNGSTQNTSGGQILGTCCVFDSMSVSVNNSAANVGVDGQRTTVTISNPGFGSFGGSGSKLNGTLLTTDSALLIVNLAGMFTSSANQLDNSSGHGILIQNGSMGTFGTWTGNGNALAGISVNNRGSALLDSGGTTSITGSRSDFEFGHETVPNVRSYAEARMPDTTGTKSLADAYGNRIDAV